jgi:hypothetical protein
MRQKIFDNLMIEQSIAAILNQAGSEPFAMAGGVGCGLVHIVGIIQFPQIVQFSLIADGKAGCVAVWQCAGKL